MAEKKQDGVYYIRTECRNCHDNEVMDVPKGVTIRDFLADKKCEHCGCKDKLYGW